MSKSGESSVPMDYSYCNAAFIDGLKAFLDYTAPNPIKDETKEGLVVRRRLQKRDFEKRCIQRWAISELADLIVENPQDPVEETTYKFVLKLLQFAEEAVDKNTQKVFQIAADFIDNEVVNLFRAKEGVYP